MSNPVTHEAILAAAQAMHRRFEQRAKRRNPFHTRQSWEAIGDDCRQEFIDRAKVALRGPVDGDLVLPALLEPPC
jgi:hypothetical protein